MKTIKELHEQYKKTGIAIIVHAGKHTGYKQEEDNEPILNLDLDLGLDLWGEEDETNTSTRETTTNND